MLNDYASAGISAVPDHSAAVHPPQRQHRCCGGRAGRAAPASGQSKASPDPSRPAAAVGGARAETNAAAASEASARAETNAHYSGFSQAVRRALLTLLACGRLEAMRGDFLAPDGAGRVAGITAALMRREGLALLVMRRTRGAALRLTERGQWYARSLAAAELDRARAGKEERP